MGHTTGVAEMHDELLAEVTSNVRGEFAHDLPDISFMDMRIDMRTHICTDVWIGVPKGMYRMCGGNSCMIYESNRLGERVWNITRHCNRETAQKCFAAPCPQASE